MEVTKLTSSSSPKENSAGSPPRRLLLLLGAQCGSIASDAHRSRLQQQQQQQQQPQEQQEQQEQQQQRQRDGQGFVECEEEAQVLCSSSASSGVSEEESGAKGMALVAPADVRRPPPPPPSQLLLRSWGFPSPPPSCAPQPMKHQPHQAQQAPLVSATTTTASATFSSKDKCKVFSSGGSNIQLLSQVAEGTPAFTQKAATLGLKAARSEVDLEDSRARQVHECLESKRSSDLVDDATRSSSVDLEQQQRQQELTRAAAAWRFQEQHQQPQQQSQKKQQRASLGQIVAAAADFDSPTSEQLKRPSFKNDCGFLKLLPSKRKFCPEDHQESGKMQKSASGSGNYVLSADGVGEARINSSSSAGNATSMSKRSLLLHLKTTSANDLKEFNSQSSSQRECSSSTGKERIRGASPSKPVAGSTFMRWMIDVGKGLAKKRCFGNNPVQQEQQKQQHQQQQRQHHQQQQRQDEQHKKRMQQSTDISPLSSPVATKCVEQQQQQPVGRHSKATIISNSKLSTVARVYGTSKPWENGRAEFSPQSCCQNMDISPPDEQVAHDTAAAAAAAAAVVVVAGIQSRRKQEAEGCDMQTSGDDGEGVDKRQVLPASEERAEDEDEDEGEEVEEEEEEEEEEQCCPVEDVNKTEAGRAEASGGGNEGTNSQHATEGTAAQEQQQRNGLLASDAQQQQQQQSGVIQQHQHEQHEQSGVVSSPRLVGGSFSRKKAAAQSGGEASFDMWTSSCMVAHDTNSPKPTANVNAGGAPNHEEQANVYSQGMAEYVVSMASVKSWVTKNRWNNSSIGKQGGSSSSKPCSFCGLSGHSVSECSETLDCELKDLERRSAALEDMKTELRDMPCLRCLGMGHLGVQCRFTVTEAASRARENSELRSWNLTRRLGCSKAADSSSQQQVLLKNPQQQQQQQQQQHQQQQHQHQQQQHQHQQQVLWTQNSNTERKAATSNGKQRIGGALDKNANAAAPTAKPVKDNTIASKQEMSPKENKKVEPAAKEKAAPAGEAVISRRKHASDSPPPIPTTMLAAIEAVRLSRSELWRWVETPDFSSQVRGFFLRLRFGRWEKDLGGTGYRMARIRGAIKKSGAEDKNMSVSVDLGDLECTVDSQYVSNHPFTEAELGEWWRGRWKAGKRLITDAELLAKAQRRGCSPQRQQQQQQQQQQA